MFTGIIEAVGQVEDITSHGTNKTFRISSPITGELKVDQSIAHNGVCLTVEEIKESRYRVTAVKETLDKTNLGAWEVGTFINLERSLLPTSRLDGHFVQGHVDTTGKCTYIKDCNGSFEISFEFAEEYAPLVIEKGSISVNGVSLTAFGVGRNSFKVAIIPFTWGHTNLQYLKEGDGVNLEFDMVGKYILRKKTC
jgi:riboflavin synthase